MFDKYDLPVLSYLGNREVNLSWVVQGVTLSLTVWWVPISRSRTSELLMERMAVYLWHCKLCLILFLVPDRYHGQGHDGQEKASAGGHSVV